MPISYTTVLLIITALWCLVRAVCAIKSKCFHIKREGQLLLVYVCLVVVVRFTFFPFSSLSVPPLNFEPDKALLFRINLIPLVNLLDYPAKASILLNVIGNIAMFIPLGIVWPYVFKHLNTHIKVIAAGVGVSFSIELLQLPFYERVSDVDDLLLNSFGFLIGYGIYLLVKNKTAKLFVEALLKFAAGVVLLGVLLFGSAGTTHFWGGRLLMGVLFVPMFLAGIVMLFKNPALLQKRLQAKESRKQQDTVVKLSGLMFLVGFALAGLGVRFHWYTLPKSVSLVAALFFLTGYVLYAEVLRENAYLSRTIEIQEKQTVIDTGLYGIVRHPMYSATLLLFLSMPLVLGSLYAFLVFLTYPFLIAKRIRDEEALLEQELDGYRAYKQKIKYRLIPFVW